MCWGPAVARRQHWQGGFRGAMLSWKEGWAGGADAGLVGAAGSCDITAGMRPSGCAEVEAGQVECRGARLSPSSLLNDIWGKVLSRAPAIVALLCRVSVFRGRARVAPLAPKGAPGTHTLNALRNVHGLPRQSHQQCGRMRARRGSRRSAAVARHPAVPSAACDRLCACIAAAQAVRQASSAVCITHDCR